MLTSQGCVFGRRVAIIVCKFSFLGGRIGVAAAERITAAVQRRQLSGCRAGLAKFRWHPYAGRHRRVPADGEDRCGRQTLQTGGSALLRVLA
uniref:ZnfB n=1 Tax=Mycobacterium leprae TaxID=1769 RepID=Q50131_MYCLR|nr:znfB [Mycobacterium leprae]